MELDPKLDRMISKWESDGYKHVMLPGTSMTCDTAAPLIRSALEAPAPRSADGVVEALREARRGMDMVHNGLMDPTRPRQAVGEVAAHWLSRIDTALASLSQPAKGAEGGGL